MKSARCSENFTRLMNAERCPRVRSGSGAARSLALKSAIFAACANRCLRWWLKDLSSMEDGPRTGGIGGCSVRGRWSTCPSARVRLLSVSYTANITHWILCLLQSPLDGGLKGVVVEAGDILETGDVDGLHHVWCGIAEGMLGDGESPLAERVDDLVMFHKREPELARRHGGRTRGGHVLVTRRATGFGFARWRRRRLHPRLAILPPPPRPRRPSRPPFSRMATPRNNLEDVLRKRRQAAGGAAAASSTEGQDGVSKVRSESQYAPASLKTTHSPSSGQRERLHRIRSFRCNREVSYQPLGRSVDVNHQQSPALRRLRRSRRQALGRKNRKHLD